MVTGASGGIGLELAKLLAADGYQLVLVARSQKTLDKVGRQLAKEYEVPTRAFRADLSDPKAVERLVQRLRREKVAVEVLVNNAGFATNGPFVGTDLRSELEMIQVNVAALTHLAKLLLPGMLRLGFGRILNVASIAAFQPGPLMAVYYATKAYVLSFSQALSAETAGTGVTVTALCPGPTGTGFAKRAELAGSALFRHPMSAEKVARIGYRAMKQGRPMVISGLRNQLFAFTTRFMPRMAAAAVAGRASRRGS